MVALLAMMTGAQLAMVTMWWYSAAPAWPYGDASWATMAVQWEKVRKKGRGRGEESGMNYIDFFSLTWFNETMLFWAWLAFDSPVNRGNGLNDNI